MDVHSKLLCFHTIYVKIFYSNVGILMKIYLDPGHGGSDPGVGGNGLKEKDITLDNSAKIT